MTRREVLALLGSFAVAPLAEREVFDGYTVGSDGTLWKHHRMVSAPEYFEGTFNGCEMSVSEIRYVETRYCSIGEVSRIYNLPPHALESMNASRN